MATTEQRLDKAVTEFKLLRDEVKALREETKFLKESLAKKFTTMRDVYVWYLERLQTETDELTTNKKG